MAQLQNFQQDHLVIFAHSKMYALGKLEVQVGCVSKVLLFKLNLNIPIVH